MRKKIKKFKTRRNNLTGSSTKKTTADHELSRVQFNLSCAFEYGVNFSERVISITDEIDEGWYHIVDQALTHMESISKSTITIRINSPGGDTYAAMGIVGRMLKSSAYVVTEGYGHIMSAATLILAAGKSRKIHKWCRFMHHEASYALDGQKHSEHKHTVNQIEQEEMMWADAMAEMSEMSADFWKEEGIGLDAYFTAEQLLEYGVVDEVF